MAPTPLVFKPPFIAHRGASAQAPENTLAAFKRAKLLGASWIEFDVQLTACGEAVILHDESLERTTNGQGLVSEVTDAYLKTLDAGSWFSADFAGEGIPTLKALLQFLERYPLAANIELKPLPGKEADLVQKVLSEVANYWPKVLPAPLFSSFSIEALRELRRQKGGALLGLLIDDFFPGWEKIGEEIACSSFNLNQALLTPEALKKLKQMGKPMLTYTVNEPQRALDLLANGVSAVFSDCPDALVERLIRNA